VFSIIIRVTIVIIIMLFITCLKAISSEQKTLFCYVTNKYSKLQLRNEVLHENGPVESIVVCPN
jgi:hypothetical protein